MYLYCYSVTVAKRTSPRDCLGFNPSSTIYKFSILGNFLDLSVSFSIKWRLSLWGLKNVISTYVHIQSYIHMYVCIVIYNFIYNDIHVQIYIWMYVHVCVYIIIYIYIWFLAHSQYNIMYNIIVFYYYLQKQN